MNIPTSPVKPLINTYKKFIDKKKWLVYKRF